MHVICNCVFFLRHLYMPAKYQVFKIVDSKFVYNILLYMAGTQKHHVLKLTLEYFYIVVYTYCILSYACKHDIITIYFRITKTAAITPFTIMSHLLCNAAAAAAAR